ncbi:ABC transporter substrate-binding protein [Prescottella equi]|uniref:Virulence factor Mce family protein n=1 Tax=Prescottella equi ATCC 33707 TaxID=525370 RepID=E9T438_RHOHA|nr:virulence factor Mce family protein [Prescottella equi ATCC 33707]ERN44569.1 mce family protein mce4b [Prescottella equi NBRC 101255 = C 7]SUE04416.1 mce family protein mce4b [Prescottella equi]GBF16015.1 mce related protein [Rhodococcus sp. Br-6]SUE20143.1 mce family protein mce4b [Prescottella equi]
MKRQLRGVAAPLTKLVIFALVTILATGALALTIANSGSRGGTEFSARFTDVTSLNKGDEVRIAGVRVGQVTKIEIVDDREAQVTFALTDRDWLPASTTATIRFRNLVGQRYIALEQGTGQQGFKMSAGETIPLDRTKPAVNLTTLFNGFRPLFQTLSADDVNKLSYQIIQVFQGEGGTIEELVANTASLTNTIADKDKVIGDLVTNLNRVLETVNKRDEQVDQLIVNTERLVSGLSADRGVIGQSVQSLSELTSATADLLVPTRPSIQGSIAGLNTLAGHVNERSGEVNQVLANLPVKMEKLGRAGSYGSWFQFYLCGIDVVAGPGTAPQLNLPSDLPTINQPIYTNAAPRCWADGEPR